MKALDALNKYLEGDISILKYEKWLKYLALTKEKNVNFERVNKLSEINVNSTLTYVKKSLEILDEIDVGKDDKGIIEEVLKWSEVSKTGNKYIRKLWKEKGFNLYAHNIGSSQIYDLEINSDKNKVLVKELIKTHGLLGQYLRGEVPLYASNSINELISDNITKDRLFIILESLNKCIIAAVSTELWESKKDEVKNTINIILDNKLEEGMTIKARIKSLRSLSIKNGENFENIYSIYKSDEEFNKAFNEILADYHLWYVESALYDFTFLEFYKIFLLIYFENKIGVTQISFEKMMKSIYYDHKGEKKINIYKKRIIEKYLNNITIEDIINNNIKKNIHIKHSLTTCEENNEIMFFNFKFSIPATKLIEFCEVAEQSESIYEKSIILLFDLFDFRKDKYDRFHNENEYLETMNKSVNHKAIILDHIVGNKVIDIGPGGGALMNMIEDFNASLDVTGLDISKNVIDSLNKKKQLENRKWNVLYGDALEMTKYLKEESIDTVIFSSIIHELFSYIEFDGSKFNHDVIKEVLKSAYQVLNKGGRIIIRDGIMSEPTNINRIIKFRADEGLEYLKRYKKDFKGREITYEVIGHNEVLLPINDAMEFLYTYTWGEDSYVHEVNEQFGYLTPTGYKNLIKETLKESVEIIEFKHYLQDGYSVALSPKIEFYDDEMNPSRLPDSTCFIVIEKIK